MPNPEKVYPIKGLMKEDLRSLRPDADEKIDALTDVDMERIADKLSEALHEEFLIALEVLLIDQLGFSDEDENND